MKKKYIIFWSSFAVLTCGISVSLWHRENEKHLLKTQNHSSELNNNENKTKPLFRNESEMRRNSHGLKAMQADFRIHIKEMRESGRYDQSYVQLLEMGWENLAECFQYIATHGPDESLERRKSDILSVLATFDIELLTAGLPLLLNESEKNYVISSLTGSLSRKHPSLLIGYAKEHFDKKAKENAIMRSVPALAKNGDIDEATSSLLLIETAILRKESVTAIAKTIATQNDSVSIAVEWASRLPAEEDRKTAEFAILHAKSSKLTPEAVIQMMDAFHETETRTAAIAIVAKKLVQQDPIVAAAWVNSLPTEIADKVQGTLAMETGRKDINFGTQIAVSMKAENQQQIQHQSDAIHNLGYLAYQSNPKQVPAWLETLPEQFRQNEAGDFAGKWICDDPANAKAWIYNLPEGAMREKTLYGAATSMELHPDVAAEILSKMTDKKLQAVAQEHLNMVMTSLREQGRLDLKMKGR